MSILISPVSPLSKVTVTPAKTEIITPLFPVVTSLYPVYEENVLGDSWLVQKEAVEQLHLKILDKWLYKPEMCHILKYFRVVNGKVELIKKKEEYKDNKICNDSNDDVELKADYIEEHFFSRKDMRKILQRMVDELGYKWYQFTNRESFVADCVEKFLRKKIKQAISD